MQFASKPVAVGICMTSSSQHKKLYGKGENFLSLRICHSHLMATYRCFQAVAETISDAT